MHQTFTRLMNKVKMAKIRFEQEINEILLSYDCYEHVISPDYTRIIPKGGNPGNS